MSLHVCIQTFSVSFLPYVFGVAVLTFPQYFRRACVPLTLSPLMCAYIMVRLDGFEPENHYVCGLDGAPTGILSKPRISTIPMYT